MSSVAQLPTGPTSTPGMPGVRLALPPGPGGGGRPGLRRRAALGLALLVLAVLAVLAVLVATGTIRLPGSGSTTTVPGRQASRAAATETAPQGAPTAERGFAAGADLELARAQVQLRASEALPAPDRVDAPTHAKALFAQHSWFVPKPAPPPPPPEPPELPPPPPPPTAPPFPYTFVGNFAPKGDRPVFFLARGDRVIDAHVGDRLDGVYQFESAAGGQLVFVYLPLNIRQNLAAGVSK